MSKKVLVTDRLSDEGIEVLRDRGYEVDVRLDMTEGDLLETIPAYEALIVRSATSVTKEVLDRAENLKIIGRAGVTTDTIDIVAATDAGVIVCNAPTSNIVSTAEHTMALMLAAAGCVPQANASMKANGSAISSQVLNFLRKHLPFLDWDVLVAWWQNVRARLA